MDVKTLAKLCFIISITSDNSLRRHYKRDLLHSSVIYIFLQMNFTGEKQVSFSNLFSQMIHFQMLFHTFEYLLTYKLYAVTSRERLLISPK